MMVNRSRKVMVVSLFTVAVVLVTGAQGVGAEARVITLANAVTIPAGGFVDLGPVDVSGFENVSFTGLTLGAPVSFTFGFANEPGTFADPVSTNQVGGCSLFGTPPSALGPVGVICGTGLFSTVFPVGGRYLLVRLGVDPHESGVIMPVTLKAYLTSSR
jgi:hypothetical protein